MTAAGSLGWDAALSLLFFLQHSGMVRRPFRAWLGRGVPAHWHGVLYTVASAAALLAVAILWQPSRIVIGVAEGPVRWILRGALVASVLVFAWGAVSIRGFDAFGTAAMLAGFTGKHPPRTPLVVRGPYQWVRHPFYSSSIIAILACPALTLDRLLFDILWAGWVVLGAMLEERDLLAQYGEAYREYRRRTPMLVPRLRG